MEDDAYAIDIDVDVIGMDYDDADFIQHEWEERQTEKNSDIVFE